MAEDPPPPIFAVGDIHGQAGEFDRVRALIDTDPEAGAPVVFLGDYIDRGPDSAGVIARLIAGQAAGRPWIALAGNHDIYLRDFLAPGAMSDAEARWWLGDNLGGAETLASYGVATRNRAIQSIRADAEAAVPRAHRDWLSALPRCHATSAQVFVHAGIRPGVPLDAQDPDDLLWIREGFLDDPRDHGRLVVHGHTAAEGLVHRGNRVNLDNGAAFGSPLAAALIRGRDVDLLTDAGRVRLRPGESAPPL